MTVQVRKYTGKNRRTGWEVDIRIRLADGRELRERRRAPVSTRDQAHRWGRGRERILLTQPGEETAPRKEVPTLEEFAPRYISGYAKANRQKHSGVTAKESIIKNHLVPRLGRKRLDEIGDEDVQRLKSKLEHLNNKTVNNVLTTLNTLLKVAVRWKVIDAMPCRIELLKISKSDRSFHDFAEYERLVDAAKKLDSGVHVAVLLGGDAGLRASEIIALEWVDLDLGRGLLRVRNAEVLGAAGDPKGGKSDWLPMTSRLCEALKAHHHLRGPRVLYRDNGRTVTWKVLRLWIQKAERRAGLPVTGHVHVLRHTFCSHMAVRGAPAKAIQELARHQNLTTTQQYMHLSPAALRDAIRLLEQGRGGQSRGEILETGFAMPQLPVI